MYPNFWRKPTLSEMKRLCPPGMFFMMCLSIFSFSSTATPLSIRMGGWAASKLDLVNGDNDNEDGNVR